MQKFSCFYYRHILLTICFITAFIFGYAQPSNSSSASRKELLQLYAQILDHFSLHKDVSCTIDLKWNLLEKLEHVKAYQLQGNWKCAESILGSLSKESPRFTETEKLAWLLAKAEYLNNRQLYDSAKTIAEIANQLATLKKKIPEKTRALLILSFGALKTRNIPSAYAQSDSALQLARGIGDKLLEGQALLQMAFCARRNFNSSSHRAFPYYQQAIEAAQIAGDSVTLFMANMFYGTDHFELKNWEEGFPYFKKAVALSSASTNINVDYTSCINGGYTMLQKDFTKEAMMLYKKALAIATDQQLPYFTLHAYNMISGTFQQVKQYDSALYYADLAASVAGVDSFYSNNWELEAGIYADMGNYKAATSMYTRALAFDNEDFLYRNQDQLSSYEAKLKTRETELQVAEEKKRSAELEWLAAGIAFLLLTVAVAFLLQRRARKKLYLQNNIIQKQRQELEKSLSQKDILLKEIHHRVKNNLTVISSLLELQASSIEDEKAKAAITEGQNRVQSIALIHHRLYQHDNLAAIGFGAFTKDMASQLSSVFTKPGQKITMDLQVPETLLDIDTAVPLGLILNELLTNSFKYAFTLQIAGVVRISLFTDGPGRYRLVYADNGPGLPPLFDFKKSRSLGLRLIQRLSAQVGGEAVYSFDEGCKFVITFKNAVTRNQEA